MQSLQFHPIAAAFPMYPQAELDVLADRIAAHGVRLPVVLYEGQILDGRNRYLACLKLGLAVPTESFEGTWREAVEFVADRNQHHRHLSKAQLAMSAAALAELARGRPPGGRENGGIPPLTQTEAAQRLGVSRDSVKVARRVRATAVPEVSDAVVQGELSLHAAQQLAALPAREQREAVRGGKASVREALARPTGHPAPDPGEAAMRHVRGTAEMVDELIGVVGVVERAAARLAHRETPLSPQFRQTVLMAITRLKAGCEWIALLAQGAGVCDAALERWLNESGSGEPG